MNKPANADMIEYWNSDAGRKWVRFQRVMDLSLVPFGSAALDASGVALGDKVVDVGCGCGDTTFEIAQRVGPAGRVLGIDVSKPALTQARYRAGYKTGDNYQFIHGDAQTHQFDSAAFDLIFSRFGFMFFDDPVAAFRNLHGALKPGGRLALACWRPADDNEWVRLPMAAAADHIPLPALSGPGTPDLFSFSDPDRITEVLGGAGFTRLSIEPLDTPFAIDLDLDQVVEFLMQIGPAGYAVAQSAPDSATKAQVASDLRDRLAPLTAGQGVALGAAAWIVTARAA